MTTVASNARTALTPEQLEGDLALDRLGEGVDAGLRRAAQLAGLRAEALVLAGELLGFLPRQPDPCTAPPVRQAVQHELGEAEPLAERVGRRHSGSLGAKAMPVNIMQIRSAPRADCRVPPRPDDVHLELRPAALVEIGADDQELSIGHLDSELPPVGAHDGPAHRTVPHRGQRLGDAAEVLERHGTRGRAVTGVAPREGR